MMEECYAVSINTGQLFENIQYRHENNKIKSLHIIQKLLAENFKKITGLTVQHSHFLTVCRTFVNKLKTNNGRKDINVLMMSPTVHRFIVHGHVFLQWAKEVNIPLGKFSESALEMRNKDRRKARLRFSRKTSRLHNIKDIYHYLLKTSDPLVNAK